MKIRGTAAHVFERYCQLARDANASGDRIAAENYLQHAEHYYRIMTANGPLPRPNGQPGPQPATQQPGGEFEGDGQDQSGEVTAAADPAVA